MKDIKRIKRCWEEKKRDGKSNREKRKSIYKGIIENLENEEGNLEKELMKKRCTKAVGGKQNRSKVY